MPTPGELAAALRELAALRGELAETKKKLDRFFRENAEAIRSAGALPAQRP
jgi:hypothetical protein